MLLPELAAQQISYHLIGVSALDWFVRGRAGSPMTLRCDTDLVDLSAKGFELAFPAVPGWDALITSDSRPVLIHMGDDQDPGPGPGRLTAFSFDPVRRAFKDPLGWYEALSSSRHGERTLRSNSSWTHADLNAHELGVDSVLDAAVLAARYNIVPPGYPRMVPELEGQAEEISRWPEWQRLVLEHVLTGPYAWNGLDILFRSGFMATAIPELLPMNNTDHSKEDHPEGNVWRHTMETFKYRKRPELALGLALLFHDIGKPDAETRGAHRFSQHAEIGASMARSVLRRLGFGAGLQRDVPWLVNHHMMPGALERLPDHRRDPVMAEPLFPDLLELYRCDLSSTYRGPDSYYRAARVYRAFTKRTRRRYPA